MEFSKKLTAWSITHDTEIVSVLRGRSRLPCRRKIARPGILWPEAMAKSEDSQPTDLFGENNHAEKSRSKG